MKRNVRLIFLIYGLSLVVLITISLLFSQQIKALIESGNQIEHTYKIRSQIILIQTDLLDAESNQRAYFVTKDSSFLRPIRQSQLKILEKIEVLKKLVVDNIEQKQILVSLNAVISARYQLLYQAVEDIKEGNEDVTTFKNYSYKGRDKMEDFKKLAARMEQIEVKRQYQKETTKRRFEAAAPLYSKLSLFISCLFQVASFFFILREFNRTFVYQKQLEKKVHELNNLNAELEQITFVASHDLQEPLRKIRTFCDRLLNKHNQDLNEEGKLVVERIVGASSRMQGLISDLIDFSSLTRIEETIKPINLNNIVAEVLAGFDATIKEQDALITIEHLPTVEGYEQQLKILFVNFIDNALKFSRPGVKPIIKIATRVAKGAEVEADNQTIKDENFYAVSVTDNGIGFEKNFAHKIFVLFQRLHGQNSEYAGKGVGLAICKRIMVNHNGYILATANNNNGATFTVYFPVT